MCIQVRPFDQALLNSIWDLNPLYAFHMFHVLAYPVIHTIVCLALVQCDDFFSNLCMNIYNNFVGYYFFLSCVISDTLDIFHL